MYKRNIAAICLLQKQRDTRGGGLVEDDKEFHTVDSKPMIRHKASGGQLN